MERSWVIIVTGGCGFIGSHIVDSLIKKGNKVSVIDDLSANENENFYYNKAATYHKLDISKDDCSNIFKNVDYVFHLAARSRIQPTVGSPNECFEVNVVGTQRVLEWSRLNSIKSNIFRYIFTLRPSEFNSVCTQHAGRLPQSILNVKMDG